MARSKRLDTDIQRHERSLKAWNQNVRRWNAWPIPELFRWRDCIFNVAVSLRDRVRNESLHTATFLPPVGFANLSNAAQLDTIVDLVLPWHLTFIASWQAAGLETFWIRYEELIADPETSLFRVFIHLGREDFIAAIPEAWAAAMAEGDSRRNFGTAGRGGPAFSDGQVARLHDLAARFPNADFPVIGLDGGS